MKRRGVGGNSRASGAAGFFGTMLGIGSNSNGRKTQTQQASASDVITPKNGGKVTPSVKEVSIGVSPYGEIVNLPLWERHCLLAGQSGSG